MKKYKIIVMGLSLAVAAVQPVMVGEEMSVLGKCWSFLTKIPLFPGTVVADTVSDVKVGDYPVGSKFQGLLAKGIVSLIVYYILVETISSLQAKYKKMKRDNPKRQMIQAAVDQLVFLKEAQEKLQARSQSREKQEDKKQESAEDKGKN